MGSQMLELESQDIFATPSMSWNRDGSRLRRTTGTPPQSPSRSVKRRNQTKIFDDIPTPLVKTADLPKCEDCYHSQPVRKNNRNLNRDYKPMWRRMGCETCYTQERPISDITEPRGGVFLSGEETRVHKQCEKQSSSVFICCGLLLLMLLSGFTGAVCYSYVYELYFKNTDAPSLLEATGVNAPKELAIKVQLNDLDNSLSYLSAATQSEISQLKQSVRSLAQELVAVRQTCQNKQNVVQTDKIPGSVYEDLLGRQADLTSAGNLGYVLATPETETVKLKFVQLPKWLSYFVGTPHTPASTTIMGLIRDVGDCWMFAGQEGRLVLALHTPSLLTSVSITHIASGDLRSAPKSFKVLAHYSEEDLDNEIVLGEFQYNKDGPWRQTFLLDPNIVKDELLRIVEFRFVTNHGHPYYTCIYRVHVHGLTVENQ